MEIDVNLNNKQKHWILILLDKAKKSIKSFFRFLFKCLKSIGRFLKKWRKWIILLIIIIALIPCIYHALYLKTIHDIKSKLSSQNDSIRIENAYKILSLDTEWNDRFFDDYSINESLRDSHEDAFNVIEKAAFAGNKTAQFYLGCLYNFGEYEFVLSLIDMEKAAYWYDQAANKGHLTACNNLGMCYLNGDGVEQNLQKAVYFLKEAAEGGNDYGQTNYGDLFVNGVIVNGQVLVPKDIEKAKAWWKKAVAQGNENAKDRLQKIY